MEVGFETSCRRCRRQQTCYSIPPLPGREEEREDAPHLLSPLFQISISEMGKSYGKDLPRALQEEP